MSAAIDAVEEFVEALKGAIDSVFSDYLTGELVSESPTPNPVGSVVYVTGDTANYDHGFKVGQEVEVVGQDYNSLLCEADSGDAYYVAEADLDIFPPDTSLGSVQVACKSGTGDFLHVRIGEGWVGLRAILTSGLAGGGNELFDSIYLTPDQAAALGESLIQLAQEASA